MLSRNKETLCWELSGEKSPEYTEPPEPVLEAIGGFINADNLIWEGTATELIEKLEPTVTIRSAVKPEDEEHLRALAEAVRQGA